METLKFKTTIRCSGCLAQVTPALNKTAGENSWRMDISAPEKILTVDTNEGVNAREVIEAVEGAGFKAELLSRT